MKKNLTSFAENIYKFREKLNKSQSQFADYISKELKKEGINFEYTNKSISKWESADSVPSVEVLIVLSKLMNVSMDTLLKDKIEQFNFPKENSTIVKMEERFKTFPNVYINLFGRDTTMNYGILGNIAQSITEYYDEDYITDEEFINKISVSCPYAIATYKDNDISDLMYLCDPINSKVTILDDYVKDVNNRKYIIKTKRKEEEYIFKNNNLDWMLMLNPDPDSVPTARTVENLGVSNIKLFKENFLKKYNEVKQDALEYQNCNLLKDARVRFGYDFDNRTIMFYLDGELNLSKEELEEIWKKLGVSKFHNVLNKVGKKTAREFLGDLLD